MVEFHLYFLSSQTFLSGFLLNETDADMRATAGKVASKSHFKTTKKNPKQKASLWFLFFRS